MKKQYIFIVLVAGLLQGCNFLDKNPDNRTTIDSKQKVQLLLVSAYSEANPNSMAEVTSDNMIDNNAPTADGQTYSLSAYNQTFHQIFAFEDVNTGQTQDSPYYLWQGDYKAISVANQALEAIEKLEAEGIDMHAEKAEALLTRAWHHFRLACIFCQAYGSEEWNNTHYGIVYMTAPETTVKPEYHRETLAETYKHIQEDLELGVSLAEDSYFSVPKYHFNVAAAHAFAARFYLYTRQWEKVVDHANYVLGTDSATIQGKMLDASYIINETPSSDVEVYSWIDAASPSNLLIQTSMSSQIYLHMTSYGRYNLNGNAKSYSVSGPGPCWENTFPGIKKWTYKSEYGVFIAKLKTFFEYTNKVAGTGYRHTIQRQFTTNETLLCRAEAYVHLGDLDAALRDLQIWCKSYDVKETSPMTALTDAAIRKFYKTPTKTTYANASFTPTLHMSDMCPGWTLPDNSLPYLYCCLHFRRIETMHDGLRLQDLKRYGIEWKHTIGQDAQVKFMQWDDDRRALQLPEAVIVAGLEPNPRETVGDHITVHYVQERQGDPSEAELFLVDQTEKEVEEKE